MIVDGGVIEQCDDKMTKSILEMQESMERMNEKIRELEKTMEGMKSKAVKMNNSEQGSGGFFSWMKEKISQFFGLCFLVLMFLFGYSIRS